MSDNQNIGLQEEEVLSLIYFVFKSAMSSFQPIIGFKCQLN